MPNGQNPVNTALLFADEDKAWHMILLKHLSDLKREGLITLWDVSQIVPGTNRVEAVEQHLESASLILLLVSAACLTFYAPEIEQTLRRQVSDDVVVIPILLHPVDWQNTRLSHLQPLPGNFEPITGWQSSDAAFAEVVAGIRRALQDLSFSSNVNLRSEKPSSRGPTNHPVNRVGPVEIPLPDTSRHNQGISKSTQGLRPRFLWQRWLIGIVVVVISIFVITGALGYFPQLPPHPVVTPTSVVVPTATPTIAATLTDDFNVGSIPNSSRWQENLVNGPSVVVREGQLHTIPVKNTISYAFLQSLLSYSAIGKSVVIQVLQVSAGSAVDTCLGLKTPDERDAIQICYAGGYGYLDISGWKFGSLVPKIPYDSITQKWWRIREQADNIFVDVSPDDVTWTNICAHNKLFDMSNVKVFFGSDEYSTDINVGEAVFDNFYWS